MQSAFRVAIIVNPELPVGLVTNTASAIAVGLGARFPDLGGRRLTDSQERTIDVSSQLPVSVLQAEPEVIRALLLKALPQDEDRAIVPFPAFARSLHAYSDYESTFPSRDLSGEIIDGVGLAGPEKWVKSLTGALRLLR